MGNSVFIATSIDGYISDRNGGLSWLEAVPNPEQIEMGFHAFMSRMDAIVMGRNTFETVAGFDIPWPYSIPVFVLSSAMSEIPEKFRAHAFLIKGSIPEVLAQLHQKGLYNLYIDGGRTIQSFLQEDKIDEMILTRMPLLLGGGAPLFSVLPVELNFTHCSTEVFLGQVVQTTYKRVR